MRLATPPSQKCLIRPHYYPRLRHIQKRYFMVFPQDFPDLATCKQSSEMSIRVDILRTFNIIYKYYRYSDIHIKPVTG